MPRAGTVRQNFATHNLFSLDAEITSKRQSGVSTTRMLPRTQALFSGLFSVLFSGFAS